MKPIENLGHEAHCTGCDCLYPELERLWKREVLLEQALQTIHDVLLQKSNIFDGADQVSRSIRAVLCEYKTLMPDEEVAELIIQKRAAEKQKSRDQDAADLKSGKITKEELRDRNSYFAVDAEVDFGQDDF